MSDIDDTKLEMWKKKGLTLRARMDANPPAVDRDDIPEDTLEEKLERGDILQKLRLRYYPTLDITKKKNNFYVGTVKKSLDELEDLIFKIGYRNNPTAYVETIEGLGTDDGSYARNEITESQEFPYLGIGRPFGIVTWWNRVKEQNHLTTFVDGDYVHIFVHKEASAWLQPIRHVTLSEGDDQGSAEFKLRWNEKYDIELQNVLNYDNQE